MIALSFEREKGFALDVHLGKVQEPTMPRLSQVLLAMTFVVPLGCLVACLAVPPQTEARRQEPETKPATIESADAGTKALPSTDAASGSPVTVDAVASEPEVASLHAKAQPCDGYSPIQDAGADAAHLKDGGVNGRLPPEVIQKLVRTHFGAMRLCYENGMRRNRNLSGRITTKFVIGPDGAVKMVALACTSVPDDLVVECVLKAFGNLQFPAPDGGMVTVVYPIMFNAGD
jgi:outer membrane biosynthesis protein TonB